MKHRIARFLGISAVPVLIICAPDSVDKDTTPPDLDIGAESDTIYIGMEWEEPGYSATDDIDGDLASEVTTAGTVGTGAPGTHTLVYRVTDRAGNSTEKERKITVLPDPDMVAWYPCNGDARDYSGHGLDGTTKGSLESVDDRFDTPEAAYSYDGSSYIEIPYNKQLDLTEEFTFSIWARSAIEGDEYASVPGGVGFVFDMGNGGEKDYGLFYYPSDKAMTFRYNFTNVADSSIKITEWHHYAMTYDGSTLRGYVDGNRVGSNSTGNGTITDLPLRIGCESKNVNRMWNGVIDDFIIFGTALSDERIYMLSRCDAFNPESPLTADTTQPPDTTTDTTDTIAAPTGLAATISGTAGDLSLKLSWNAVSGAFAYGIYYNEGETVSVNDYYRVSNYTYKTFSSELTEGETYTFAVIASDGDEESKLSQPLTVTFTKP